MNDALRPRPAAAAGTAVLLFGGTLLAGVAASSAPGGHQLATTLLPALGGALLLVFAGLGAKVAVPTLRGIARPAGVGLAVGAAATLVLLGVGAWVFVGGAAAGSVLQSLLGAELVAFGAVLAVLGRR